MRVRKKYKKKKQYPKSKAACPLCGGPRAYSSAACADCRRGGALSWEETASLYNFRNPDDPIDAQRAKRIGDTAMKKIRIHLAAIKETGETKDHPLSIALQELMKELYDG